MTARSHDPDRTVLRCSRADLLAVTTGTVAPGLVAGDQLLAAAMTVRDPGARWAVVGPDSTLDGYVGPQLTVAMPAAPDDAVVEVVLVATAALARQLHRALDPPVRASATATPTTYETWDEAVAAVAEDQLRQLRWSDGAAIPSTAALVLAVGPDRLRRLRQDPGGGTVVEDVVPAQVWSDCCVLAARATRSMTAPH